jgi:hypothetical protein
MSGGQPAAEDGQDAAVVYQGLRASLPPDAALVARGGGYALNVGSDAVDAARLEQLTASAGGAER